MVTWSLGEFISLERDLAANSAVNIAAVEKVKTLNAIANMDYEEYYSIKTEAKEWMKTQK